MTTLTLPAAQASELVENPKPLPPFSQWLREFLADRGHTYEVAGRIAMVDPARIGQVARGGRIGRKALEGLIRGYGLEAEREKLERLAGLYIPPADDPTTTAISPDILRDLMRDASEEGARRALEAAGIKAPPPTDDDQARRRAQEYGQDALARLEAAGVTDFPVNLRNYSGGASQQAVDDWIEHTEQLVQWALKHAGKGTS